MDTPERRRRLPGPGALFAIYLGIGIALRLGGEVYVREFRSDFPYDSIRLVTESQLPLSDRLGALVVFWIVPIVAWPLIVVVLAVSLVQWAVNAIRRG